VKTLLGSTETNSKLLVIDAEMLYTGGWNKSLQLGAEDGDLLGVQQLPPVSAKDGDHEEHIRQTGKSLPPTSYCCRNSGATTSAASAHQSYSCQQRQRRTIFRNHPVRLVAIPRMFFQTVKPEGNKTQIVSA
jgi:hypothetical protein